MKVQNITDIEKFFEVINSCKGKVELVTGEGDRLNLKSKLSQYVSMANIFSDGTIAELELLAYEPEDINKLGGGHRVIADYRISDKYCRFPGFKPVDFPCACGLFPDKNQNSVFGCCPT